MKLGLASVGMILGLAGSLLAGTPCPLARLPVAISFPSLGAEVVGEPADLQVTIQALEPVADAHLEVVVPAAVEVIGPLPGWTGSLAEGETASVVVRVRVPGTPSFLKARAWRQDGSARLAAIARRAIGPAPLAKPEVVNLRTDQEGTTRLLLPMSTAAP